MNVKGGLSITTNKRKKGKSLFSYFKKRGLRNFFLLFVMLIFSFSIIPSIFLSEVEANETDINPVFKRGFQSIEYQGATFDFIGYGKFNMHAIGNNSGYFKELEPGRVPNRNDLERPVADDVDPVSVNAWAIFVSRNFQNTFCPTTPDRSFGRFIHIPANEYQSAKRNYSQVLMSTLEVIYWEENWADDGCHSEEARVKRLPPILPPERIETTL